MAVASSRPRRRIALPRGGTRGLQTSGRLALTYPGNHRIPVYGIRLFGQKLGLETMRYLLRLMGEPQKSLRFIHIAGTNGKGSVAAMLSASPVHGGLQDGVVHVAASRVVLRAISDQWSADQ